MNREPICWKRERLPSEWGQLVRRTVLILLVGISSGAFAAAVAKTDDPVAVDKPVSELREMRTDRPDATESPFTVDAGHIQLEADLVSHTRDREDGDRTRESSIGAFNLRFGVSPRTELGLFVSPWTRRTEDSRDGRSITQKGFGDVVLRAKFNGWGNDGGRSAGGLIVDVTLPTAADGLGNDGVQGTVLLPFSFSLGEGWEMGAMTGLDYRRDADGSGHRSVLITTATVGRELTDKIGIYFELTSEAGDGRHVATFDTGMTFLVNPNLQFDVGANIGVSRAADDLGVFVGVARRF